MKISTRTLRIFTVIAAALLTAFIATPSYAANATVSWTNPTKYTDGSTLEPSAIANTAVQYGTCVAPVAPATVPTFGTLNTETLVPGPASSVVLTGIVAATYCFRAHTIDTQGRVGSWSAVLQKAVVEIKPLAPSGLGVVSP